MILWFIKQLASIRKILEGRAHPKRLAWGLALGVFVGLVPHGNLLAIALIILVVSLRINHSMVALAGVAVALVAARLDRYTSAVGEYVLTDPRWHEQLLAAWQLPLVPWTDLNNTVTLGSFLIGLAAVLPIYAISYPLFRRIQPTESEFTIRAPNLVSDPVTVGSSKQEPVSHENSFDEPFITVPQPYHNTDSQGVFSNRSGDLEKRDPKLVAIDTQIDVIRVTDENTASTDVDSEDVASENVQIYQSLGYLLRRLRSSQQGKAA